MDFSIVFVLVAFEFLRQFSYSLRKVIIFSALDDFELNLRIFPHWWSLLSQQLPIIFYSKHLKKRNFGLPLHLFMSSLSRIHTLDKIVSAKTSNRFGLLLCLFYKKALKTLYLFHFMIPTSISLLVFLFRI